MSTLGHDDPGVAVLLMFRLRPSAVPWALWRLARGPRGLGRVRVLDIEGVDLQPCGGTHVANTREVGDVVVTRIEKKSAMTRRVVLGLASAVAQPGSASGTGS